MPSKITRFDPDADNTSRKEVGSDDVRPAFVDATAIDEKIEEALTRAFSAPASLKSRVAEPAPQKPLPDADDYLPARMVNEFVYCQRLFYYEHVEGVFVENADTARGSAQHKRVDGGKGDLPAAQPTSGDPASSDDEMLHSRSVQLGSDRLRVVCKMDLIESITGDDLFATRKVTPVEYKSGAPRDGDDGPVMWDADRIQLALQCFILRDNGYVCDGGILYYRQTRQRVRLDVTPELEAWALDILDRARETMRGPIPTPLVDSPKCIRCSLAPVCLPDETRALRDGPDHNTATDVRRIIAPRDDRRAFYLNTPGLFVGRSGDVLVVKDKKTTVQEVRVKDVSHLGIFGNIQVSTSVVQALCEEDVPISWFSGGGWFYGITRAQSLVNVRTRIEQFKYAADSIASLSFAREFVRGKIRNQRTMLRRNHIQPPDPVLKRLARAVDDAAEASSIESLLGIEGAAAAEYFAAFSGMLRTEDGEQSGYKFDFTKRNRRPPRDPVNALLSLAYSLLSKDCMIAAHAAGFDPAVGFYHQPRHGRPGLALDVMEEFRPIIADSVVITAINNRMLSVADFVTAGESVNLTAKGRKTFFEVYENRMNSTITHPVFEYKVCYRRAIELQFRMLARRLTGEIPAYVGFTTR
jgi:CRISPR-associated protein Cas1